jgi:NifU-like protein involved in Fe-S cluster formation
VDEITNIIQDVRFLSFGCGTAIASADAMAEMCIGKTVDEASKITNIDVEKIPALTIRRRQPSQVKNALFRYGLRCDQARCRQI